MDKAGLLLANHGTKAARVTVTTVLHDSWDDRETVEFAGLLDAGARILVACSSPDKRFIRRLDLKSDVPGVVKLEQFAFIMAPRSKLNPLSTGGSRASTSGLSPSAPTTPSGPAFGDTKPALTSDGLVLQLSGDALKALAAEKPTGEWKNAVKSFHPLPTTIIARQWSGWTSRKRSWPLLFQFSI